MPAGALALTAAVAGCGSGENEFANRPRPASPITVTAAIDQGRVRVSPATFGAGPVTVIVSNQSGAAQVVTFETDEVGGSQGGITKTTGPVADRGTASFAADPRAGTYRLGVRDRGVKPASIQVGSPRPAAQNQLLQP
jgi:hypothetical protein